MFIDPKTLSPKELHNLRQNLYHHCQSRPSLELNFVGDNHGEIACFYNSSQLYIGYFCIIDDSFMPRIIYKTTAYINACVVSASGRYAICQTAHNPENDADSGAFIIMDLRYKTVLKKCRLSTGWKGITHLFIDEAKHSFFVYYGDKHIEYDFNGQARNTEKLFDVQLSEYNGYQLLSLANEMIGSLSQAWDDIQHKKLLQVISAISDDTSAYQRSLMYKALGDCYAEKHMTEQAVSAYETGLQLNAKLPVKKKLKACQAKMQK